MTERAIELRILLPSSKGKQMPLSAKNAAFTIPTCQSRAKSKPTINTHKWFPFTPEAIPTHGNKKSKILSAIVLSLLPPTPTATPFHPQCFALAGDTPVLPMLLGDDMI